MELFYLADEHDRQRLSTTGSIEAAHDCQPWYFLTEESAKGHPAFVNGLNGLKVKSCPAADAIPGAPVGAYFATAADVYRAVDAGVVAQIAADVAEIMGAG